MNLKLYFGDSAYATPNYDAADVDLQPFEASSNLENASQTLGWEIVR